MSRPALWTAIRNTLADEISAGRYGPGDRLPTEMELAERFGVNRHTLRRAIRDLAEKGVLRTRRGSGVFVSRKPTRYALGRRVRFHQNLRSIGQTPARKILFTDTRMADADEAQALAIDPGSMVHVSEGLSLADDLPLAVFRSLFPAERFPDLPDHLARDGSVSAAFAAHGLEDYFRASTEIAATRATDTIATHLGLRPGAPILRTISVNTDCDGIPVEYGRAWFSGDHVTLTLDSER